MLKRACWTAIAAASLASGIAAAQSFPSRTIHLVSGVTPGSASDTTARIVAEKLQATLGQAVIVENKLGVGGLIGAAYVAKADPDGHVISIYTSAFTVAPLLSPGPLDPKELTPVATLGTVPTVLVVSTAKNYKTVADLVAAAKAKAGGVVATTAGIGSSTHMNLERFRIAAGIEVLHVPMKGAPDALTEVLTGRADFYFALPFQVGPQVREGKLRALAVGALSRRPHDRRGRLSELRLQLLDRRAGRHQDAARDRSAAEQGIQRSRELVRGAREISKAGRGSSDDVAARFRGDDQEGVRVERPADQGGGHKSQLERTA